jgi:hypothetical protein
MKLFTFAWLGLAVTSVIAHPHVPYFPLHGKLHRAARRAAGTNDEKSYSPSPANLFSRQTTSNSTSSALASGSFNVQATILVIVRDADSATSATSGLNAYGIPYQVLYVPQAGTALPTLNTTAGGNFGGIIVASQVSYDYGGTIGWTSALTTDQWNTLYAYQIAYGVRMVQYDAYPQPAYGTTPLGGCCATGVEQIMSFTNTTAFTQAGIRSWAGVSTQGLYHYASTITDPTTTWEIAQFAPNDNFASNSTAAVINK